MPGLTSVRLGKLVSCGHLSSTNGTLKWNFCSIIPPLCQCQFFQKQQQPAFSNKFDWLTCLTRPFWLVNLNLPPNQLFKSSKVRHARVHYFKTEVVKIKKFLFELGYRGDDFHFHDFHVQFISNEENRNFHRIFSGSMKILLMFAWKFSCVTWE